MTEHLPVVAVAGSTGVGKSRLSIELASAVRDGLLGGNTTWKNSKVINADAMQAYKGLDLVTNKVTKAEMNGIEHTLFDFRELDEEYVVTEWVTDAISEIRSAHTGNQLPIVVGGTSYWLQHLLFANRLTSLEDPAPGSQGPPSTNVAPLASLSPPQQQLFDNLPVRGDDVDEATAFELHQLLTELDPATAARWHWKDARKVLRSLNIIRESDTTVQSAYEAQLDPVARFPAIVFWLYMDPSILNPALDSRIDKMVQLGLKEEIEHIRNVAPAHDGRVQMTGLNQAIGYKEFDAYLKDPNRPQLEFERGIEQMKVATRQYATRQVKWLKSRLLPAILASHDVHIIMLEIKDPAHWDIDILKPALKCLEDFLDGKPPSQTEPAGLLRKFIQEVEVSPSLREIRKIRCDVCTTDPHRPVMLDEKTEWDAHRKSRAHRRKENKGSRIEQQLKRQEEVRLQRASLRGGLESENSLVDKDD